MNVMIDLCIVPLGVGVSVSDYVARCQRILREAGLDPRLHAYGTGVEGDWEVVMGAVRRCFESLHEDGVPRIHATMRLGTRTDRSQSLQDKVDSVARKLD